MKRLFITMLACLCLSTALLAQQPQKAKQEKAKIEQKKPAISESMIMEKGKLIHFQNEKEMLVTTEMEFAGMKIWPNGNMKMKNGKMMKLREGECFDLKGQIHKDCTKLLKTT